MSATHHYRREHGLCRKCGATPEPGRKACRECLEIDVIKAIDRRDRRVKAGLCYLCCQPNPEPDRRRKACLACTAKIVASTRARRAKLSS